MKFRPQLVLDVTSPSSSSSSSSESDDETWKWGQTTYRKDNLSIGHDYLRLEGRTVSRGQLSPEKLEIEDIIGRGNFSTVRRAQWRKDATSNKVPVAIKQLCLTETSKKRHTMLLKELKTLCILESEFLVTLHGAFLQEDTIFMIMEIMDEGSLQDFFHNQYSTKISDSFIAAVGLQVLMGLTHLHASQMIHRDLKPANILLHSSGRVKLCDFGMTTLNENSMHTTVVGTTKFMAPERLHAMPYGRSSDVWSFGLVLWQCVTGEEPWSDINSMVDLIMTVEETEMEDLVPSGLPRGLEELLVGSLQKNPGTSSYNTFVYPSLRC